jgi:hypothetical protein
MLRLEDPMYIEDATDEQYSFAKSSAFSIFRLYLFATGLRNVNARYL